MSDLTPRLDLPWLMPAQAQKHVTVNQALSQLDILVQSAVVSRTQTVQPSSPYEGACYVLPETVTGQDWNGHELSFAAFQDGVWRFITPWVGLTAYVIDEAKFCVFNGAAWSETPVDLSKLDNLEGLGVGTSSDETNKFAAKLNTALWTALETAAGGTGDLRYTLNKEASSHTVSLLFQSGWSGRAELGLTGDDDFAIKASSDGANWIDGLKMRASDGRVSLAGLQLQPSATPASATASGEVGDISWDGDFIYLCVGANQWKRASLSQW